MRFTLDCFFILFNFYRIANTYFPLLYHCKLKIDYTNVSILQTEKSFSGQKKPVRNHRGLGATVNFCELSWWERHSGVWIRDKGKW